MSAVKCNTIERNDGFNLSIVFSGGEWIGDMGNVACNKPAEAVGRWIRRNEITFVYPCHEHLETYLDLPYEPAIQRPWFELIGKIKLPYASCGWGIWRVVCVSSMPKYQPGRVHR